MKEKNVKLSTQKLTKNKKIDAKNFLVTALVVICLACIITSPAVFLQSGLDGLSAWALCVLPSILPFMFFTKILASLGTLSALSRPFSRLTNTLFHAPPVAFSTFILAILSGYPVGSKMVANLFMQGQITQKEAFRMTAFCSTSGPMFIVGAVGVGMFGSAKVGYVLFFSHVVGAILNGILFRNLGRKDENLPVDQRNLSNANSREKSIVSNQQNQINLSEIVLDCAQSALSVGVIITIFFVIIQCLSPILSLLPESLRAFASGFVEITKGCTELSKLSGNLPIVLCSFVISFGGISTILQSIAMLSSIKMPVKLFVKQKVTHAIFSAFVTILLLSCLS